MNVIAELPRYLDGAAVPVALRVAATDSFFIHLRLLIEFLTKKPNLTHPAIHRDDYARGFNLSFVDLAMYRRLKTDFDFASQHVAHFSFNRVPTAKSAGIDYVDARRARARSGRQLDRRQRSALHAPGGHYRHPSAAVDGLAAAPATQPGPTQPPPRRYAVG